MRLPDAGRLMGTYLPKAGLWTTLEHLAAQFGIVSMGVTTLRVWLAVKTAMWSLRSPFVVYSKTVAN